MPVNFVAKAVITAALVATQYAIQASTKIEGPRLDETKVTLGDYGVALPMIWGTRRIEGPPIFFAEDLREVKRRRKTKGGKYNEYTYFGTWAIAIAGHEIEDVTRIWLDKKLVFDLTGIGPVTPFEGDDGFNFEDHIRVYTGTETQEADPRMVATVEAAQGAGSCPAYRGTAYVMFIDVPLEKFGNRIPQAAAEVVSSSATVYPFEAFPTVTDPPFRLWGFTFSPDYSRMMWGLSNGYEIWDVASRTRMVAGVFPVQPALSTVFGLFDSGKIYAVTDDNNELVEYSADGFSGGAVVKTFAGTSWKQQEVRILKDGNGIEHWATIPWSVNQYFYFDGSDFLMSDLTGVSWNPRGYFVDDYGDIWAVGCPPSSSGTTLHFYRLVSCGDSPVPDDYFSISGLVAVGSLVPDIEGVHYRDETLDQFVILWEEEAIYAIDPIAQTVVATKTTGIDAFNAPKQFINCRPGSSSIWLNGSEVSLADLTTLRTVTFSNWTATTADGIIYDPINHALITSEQFTDEIIWRYLDRIGGDGVTLQTIANDVAESCGITEYDFSAFTQTVDGWSTTIGTGQDMLEPLMDAYDVDIRPHDFTIQGVVRGGSSGGTIDVERFVRSGNEPRYTVKIAQAAQIPRAMVMNFADIANDQQVNSVRVSRPPEATEAAGEATLDMTTWATDTDTARQYLGRYFRRVWNGREMITNALTPQNLALEPADLRTLGLDGENVLARLIKTSLAKDGKMATEWVTDDPDLSLLDDGAGPTFDGYVPSVMPISIPSKGFVIDANLATDVHDQTNPFSYFAAAPYNPGFYPGTDFAISDSGVVDDYVPGWASVASSDAMDWGYCTNELGDALPWLLDYGNTLNVSMILGSLTGVTEVEILADSELNLLLIESAGGWEYVQFVDADLQADGSYNLTGLLRGRRGTEHLIAGHAVGNSIVVVDNDVFRRSVGASEIGDTDHYRAVTQGRGIGSALEQIVTFTAAANKPYSAVNGILTLAANDWSITADRRTRIGGAAFLSGPLPLGEVSESWQADIMDGVTVKRTISGTSLPLVYTSAQQVTDWGSNQTSLEVNLYQISPSLALRGYPLNIAA